MDFKNIAFHPAMSADIYEQMKIEEAKCKLTAIVGKEVSERIERIVDKEWTNKRIAFYETIMEAALCGSDFSKVETIQDISEIYARFIIERAYNHMKKEGKSNGA